jgi:hypothetical protein
MSDIIRFPDLGRRMIPPASPPLIFPEGYHPLLSKYPEKGVPLNTDGERGNNHPGQTTGIPSEFTS